ncbi:hypothetical protein GGR54DRAFT_623490 [Hypoxylon sp. NC1633]|nr:hypothetical protein GGR54DRAFT_623490 [Hypoxylon sp. NC1633]
MNPKAKKVVLVLCLVFVTMYSREGCCGERKNFSQEGRLTEGRLSRPTFSCQIVRETQYYPPSLCERDRTSCGPGTTYV